MSIHPETYSALVETLYQARLENRRLRISQLRRMVDAVPEARRRAIYTAEASPRWPDVNRIFDINVRLLRFTASRLAEIERLRGME